MGAQDALEAFKAQLGPYMAGTRRGEQTSTLFDLPLRSILGGVCFYDSLPELLAELDRSPEEIGARMRRLGSRPYLMHLNAMIFGFLTGLEERRADGRPAPAGDDERIERTVDFWQRVLGAYREDGADFSQGRQRVVAEADLAEPLARLGESPGRHPFARELALLQSMNFLLHGESRDGLFDHGPYAADGDGCVVVKELTDLRGGLHRWAEPTGARTLAVDRLVAIRRVAIPADALRFDMFGTMASAGAADFGAAITHEAILAASPDGEIVPVAQVADAEDLRAGVRSVNRALLETFSGLSEDERVTYGADMYANMLVGFARIGADAPEAWEAELRSRFDESARTALARMRSSSAAGAAWSRFGAAPDGSTAA